MRRQFALHSYIFNRSILIDKTDLQINLNHLKKFKNDLFKLIFSEEVTLATFV